MSIVLLREAYARDLIDLEQFEELVAAYLRGETPTLPRPVLELLVRRAWLEAHDGPGGYRVMVIGA